MSQVMLMVVSSVNGSSTAVEASGISTMSDSLIPFQPAMEEPSNILPSVKSSSLIMVEGMLTCCSLPWVSVKRRSTNFTSLSLIISRTFEAMMFSSCIS